MCVELHFTLENGHFHPTSETSQFLPTDAVLSHNWLNSGIAEAQKSRKGHKNAFLRPLTYLRSKTF